jgi:uncharacterized protein YfaP (DUF2135 family)
LNEINGCPSKEVSVNLEWANAGSDLDLYIIEPSTQGESTVSKSNLEGYHGSLSQNVQAGGQGGETYTTVCDRSPAGTYEILVNYFSGSGETVAKITLNVGSESQQIEVPLPLSVGPAGDIAIPYVIGKLVVTENRNSISYEFIPHEDECEDQITVFTSWNNVLDTDVHVYEPDLTHIWLYNRDQ